MAIRAASICRLEIQPASSAFRPYSPNCTSTWPRESPAIRPRCCLRCLTRLGASISARPRRRRGRHRRRRARRDRRPATGTAAAPARTAAPPARTAAPATGTATTPATPAAGTAPVAAVTAAAATAVAAVRRPGGRRVHVGQVGPRVALGHDLALVDPALDADAPEGRAGLVEAVVDVGAQRVQRHAAVRVALGARHLRAAQATRDLDLHALGARAHGAGERALHGAAEGDAVLELLGDRLGDELGVELRTLDLEDVHLDGLAGELVQIAAQGVHLAAGLADHDARPRGVDVDLHLAGVLADRDVGQAGVRELARDVAADLDVLEEVVGEVALVEPVRLPVVDVAHAHRLGMNLLTHQVFASWPACRW